uniref:Uncharacterized protein n=1 Tax=Heliothis virescens TaxID=7102 RepID=A0A2A4JE97_HELVI
MDETQRNIDLDTEAYPHEKPLKPWALRDQNNKPPHEPFDNNSISRQLDARGRVVFNDKMEPVMKMDYFTNTSERKRIEIKMAAKDVSRA